MDSLIFGTLGTEPSGTATYGTVTLGRGKRRIYLDFWGGKRFNNAIPYSLFLKGGTMRDVINSGEELSTMIKPKGGEI